MEQVKDSPQQKFDQALALREEPQDLSFMLTDLKGPQQLSDSQAFIAPSKDFLYPAPHLITCEHQYSLVYRTHLGCFVDLEVPRAFVNEVMLKIEESAFDTRELAKLEAKQIFTKAQLQQFPTEPRFFKYFFRLPQDANLRKKPELKVINTPVGRLFIYQIDRAEENYNYTLKADRQELVHVAFQTDVALHENELEEKKKEKKRKKEKKKEKKRRKNKEKEKEQLSRREITTETEQEGREQGQLSTQGVEEGGEPHRG